MKTKRYISTGRGIRLKKCQADHFPEPLSSYSSDKGEPVGSLQLAVGKGGSENEEKIDSRFRYRRRIPIFYLSEIGVGIGFRGRKSSDE